MQVKVVAVVGSPERQRHKQPSWFIDVISKHRQSRLFLQSLL